MEEDRCYKLYVHISPSNKRYYGITCMEPKKRWANGKGYREQSYFNNAINKYGWDNFQHIILFDNLTQEEAYLMERLYIALYNTMDRNKGYNCSEGGYGGKPHTDETKNKISKSTSGENNPMYGKHHSEEAKKKQSKAKEGMYLGETNPNAKKVRCIELDITFDTLKEASEFVNRRYASIWDSIKRGGKCAGYHWEYVVEEKEVI